MSEELNTKLQEWSSRLGRPVEELKKDFEKIKATFAASMPGKDDKYYTDLARRRLYLTIKSELISPAKPYDMISLGCTSAFDVTAGERAEKTALWNDEETREQAVIERKVSRGMVDAQGQPVPDGTPLDTREWITPPNPEKGERGRKNPRFGKPLEPLLLRSLIAFGRPAIGGAMKLITIAEYGDAMTKLIPPKMKAIRTRLNLREERDYIYICNGSRKMRFDPIELPEYPQVSMEVICNILRTAPAALRPSLAELEAWHETHKDDARRICILEGDVTGKTTEPTQYGSYRLTIEDASQENLDEPGTNIWVPEELADILRTFGRDSRVYAIGRTNIGPGYNEETGQFDREIERVQMNAGAVVVIPEFRVPPEEVAVVEKATEVK